MSRKLLLLVALVGAWAALALLCWWLYRSRRWPWPLHRDLLAVALLAALDVGFFWPVVFQGAFLPKGGGDLASFLFPRYAFAARSLSADDSSTPLPNTSPDMSPIPTTVNVSACTSIPSSRKCHFTDSQAPRAVIPSALWS